MLTFQVTIPQPYLAIELVNISDSLFERTAMTFSGDFPNETMPNTLISTAEAQL